MRATFLLFLSMFFIKFAIHIIWNWFCLCHGITGDCDAEGGAIKHIADSLRKRRLSVDPTTDAADRS